MKEAQTDFGYQLVDRDAKVGLVGEVFDSVAAKYDVMNDLMSFGVHRLWKRYTIEQSATRPGHRVLDIAGGTGDLAKQFATRVGSKGQVILADINAAMLNVGRDRLIDDGVVGNVDYCQANAETLPFESNTFDCVSIAFGLRNVTDKSAALESMLRVLRPGGRAADTRIFKTGIAAAQPRLRCVFVQRTADDGQAGGQRCRQLSLSGGIHPHAP